MPAQSRTPCAARHARRPARLLIGATLGIALACGNEPASDASSARVGDEPAGASTASPRSEAAGHSPTETVIEREFRNICGAYKKGDDQYYGERKVEELTKWLRKARSRPLGAKEQTVVELVRDVHANELLQVGRTEEAIRALEVGDARVEKAAPLAGAQTGDPASATSKSEAGPGGEEGFGPPSFEGVNQLQGGIRRLTVLRNAHLQAGEDENCVLRHTAASCILPFQPESLHTLPDHARRAGDLSLEILALQPDSVSARWILNLMRMVSGDYPEGVPAALRLPEAAFRSDEDFPRWVDRAPELGVNAVDLAGGAVMDDFDGDGLLDLVSSTANPCDGLKAFRNDGRGGFEDVTDAWNLRGQLGGLNLMHADFDGDGRLDLLVLRGGWLREWGRVRNSLLRNELEAGAGRFIDVTRAAGLATPAFPTQTAGWADYDGDGDLDLYVGNEPSTAGKRQPNPSHLFRNEGNGRFAEVAEAAGVTNLRFAKGVAWGDMDGDGDPDLYVSNIGKNRLYRNDGDGTFTDVAKEWGVEAPEGFSFATWFFDYDNDGKLDLYVGDYGSSLDAVMASYMGKPADAGRPLLYRNVGTRFEEVFADLGISQPMLPTGANYGDLDGDGWLDVYLGTGSPPFDALVPNVMLHNRGGTAFSDVSFAGGFAHLQKGHGVAFGDLDNDGDQDLFHQLGGLYPGDAYANALFENPGFGSAWVTLRLEGRSANRFGVGARIAVQVREPEGTRTIHVLAGSGGSFGGSSMQQEIGLGRAVAIEEIQIRWPGSDSRQRFEDVAPNRIYRVVEGEAKLEVIALPQLHLAGGDTRAHP
ncbi:MAG: CRTAC1 family protein, partial [Deltaproteobacteria bacterium]|nr:CRTAC1 family protein [Deltaproteobacteria bacterium]